MNGGPTPPYLSVQVQTLCSRLSVQRDIALTRAKIDLWLRTRRI
jgi:hypothetical protein